MKNNNRYNITSVEIFFLIKKHDKMYIKIVLILKDYFNLKNQKLIFFQIPFSPEAIFKRPNKNFLYI